MCIYVTILCQDVRAYVFDMFCYLKIDWTKSWLKPDASEGLVSTLLFPVANTCAICAFSVLEGSDSRSLCWKAQRYGSLQSCKEGICGLLWQPLRCLCFLLPATHNLCMVLKHSWIEDLLLVCCAVVIQQTHCCIWLAKIPFFLRTVDSDPLEYLVLQTSITPS